MLPLEWPWSSVLKLPRSPTWRSVSEGAPCCLLWGLTVRSRGLEEVVKSEVGEKELMWVHEEGVVACNVQ